MICRLLFHPGLHKRTLSSDINPLDGWQGGCNLQWSRLQSRRMCVDLQPGAEHMHLAAGAEGAGNAADDPGALQTGLRSSEPGHCWGGEGADGRESGCQDQISHCLPVDMLREKRCKASENGLNFTRQTYLGQKASLVPILIWLDSQIIDNPPTS